MATKRLFGLAFFLLIFTGAPAHAQFIVCPEGSVQQLVADTYEIHGLYLLDPSRGCWHLIKNNALTEGTIVGAGNVPRLVGRGSASFAFLLQPSPAPTAVVVKQRVFRPAEVIGHDNTLRPSQNPSTQVVLRRQAVNNRCNTKADLDDYKRATYRGEVSIDVNVYNRYHAQGYNFVPASDEIRELHFRYGAGCTATDDPSTRWRYALTGGGLFQDSGNSPFGWLETKLTAPESRNSYYTKLQVENRFVDATPAQNPAAASFRVVTFKADARSGTRSEITVSDVGGFGGYNPATWQIDWK